MITSESKKSLTKTADWLSGVVAEAKMKKQVTRRRGLTITLRVTDCEKEAIIRQAERRGQTISRYLIEKAVFEKSDSGLTIKRLTVEVGKLCRIVSALDKNMCNNHMRSASLDDVIAMQRDIYSEMLKLSAGIGGI